MLAFSVLYFLANKYFSVVVVNIKSEKSKDLPIVQKIINITKQEPLSKKSYKTENQSEGRVVEHYSKLENFNKSISRKPSSKQEEIKSVFQKLEPIERHNKEELLTQPTEVESFVNKELSIKPLIALAKKENESRSENLFSVGFGIGVNGLQFTQSGGELNSGTFASLNAPNFMMNAAINIESNFKVNFEYHSLPGNIDISSSSKIDKNKYHWKTVIFEGEVVVLEKENLSVDLLFGGEVHQVPFLSLNDDESVNLFENQLANSILGIKIYKKVGDSYCYESLLRYQTLLSSRSTSNNDFKANQKMMFDGSLGIEKFLKNRYHFGLYWFGQYENISYNFKRVGLVATSGSQQFFNSNVQFRMGYDF